MRENKDRICIRELEVYAHHGVFPEETRLGQKFFVNATLYTQLRAAGTEDDLSLSTDYGRVCQTIHSFLTEHTYKLLAAAAFGLSGHQRIDTGDQKTFGAHSAAGFFCFRRRHKRLEAGGHRLWL